jgi:hypothetical protein
MRHPPGTFLTAQYNTTFEKGLVLETFTWRRSGGTLKLSEYNIQSNLLLAN